MAILARRMPSVRTILRQLHLWLAIVLCLPLMALGISGSILVYHDEIEELFRGPAPHAAGTPHTPAEILAAAQAAAPERTPLMLRLAAAPDEPALVRLSRPRGERAPAGGSPFAGSIQLWIDPVSLATVARPSLATPTIRFLHDLHGNLLIGGRDGRVVVGWFGVVMLFMSVSGLVLWWPRGRWGPAFTVKRGASGFRLHRELHGAVGIWSLAILLVVSFSGTYIAFPPEMGAIVTSVFPGRDLRAAASGLRVQPMRGATPLDLEKGLALAREAVGDAALRVAFLPGRPDQPMRLGLVRDGHNDGAPMIVVLVDQWAGRVIEVQDPRAFTTGETIMAWQRAVHEGSGLGPIYRLLVFLSGLAMPLFVVTGIAMWLLKRRANKRTRATRLAAAPGPAAE
jgi:uncharacterized iron-regulated membrane protein